MIELCIIGQHTVTLIQGLGHHKMFIANILITKSSYTLRYIFPRI